MNMQANRASARGFTLIELMIAVMIVGILSSIAVPAYSDYVTKSRRAQAKQFMMDLATRQEQFMLDNKTYAQSTQELGFTNSYVALDMNGEQTTWANAQYVFTFVAANTSATAWELLALPRDKQLVRDTDCSQLLLNSAGVESATGNHADTCW